MVTTSATSAKETSEKSLSIILGHFEYLAMPFGLTNTSAVFQVLLNDALCDMLNCFIFVYVDNILIFFQNMEEHVQHVRLVLQRLLENSL